MLGAPQLARILVDPFVTEGAGGVGKVLGCLLNTEELEDDGRSSRTVGTGDEFGGADSSNSSMRRTFCVSDKSCGEVDISSWSSFSLFLVILLEALCSALQ